jgi:hypothetical protein
MLILGAYLTAAFDASSMTRRAEIADLPLHGGHVPRWLPDRKTRLRAVVCEAVVHHYGRGEDDAECGEPIMLRRTDASPQQVSET